MKIVELVVSRTVRVNLGDYQSVDFFVSAKAELESSDDISKARHELKRTIEQGLAHDISMHFVRRGKKVGPLEVGKRYGLFAGAKQ